MELSSFDALNAAIAALSLLASIGAVAVALLTLRRTDRIEKAKAHAETHQECLRHETDVEAALNQFDRFDATVERVRSHKATLQGMSEYGRVVRRNLDEELSSLKLRPEEYRKKRTRLADQRTIARRICSAVTDCTEALLAVLGEEATTKRSGRTGAANEEVFNPLRGRLEDSSSRPAGIDRRGQKNP